MKEVLKTLGVVSLALVLALGVYGGGALAEDVEDGNELEVLDTTPCPECGLFPCECPGGQPTEQPVEESMDSCDGCGATFPPGTPHVCTPIDNGNCLECGFDPCVCCEGCHRYPCECPDGDDVSPADTLGYCPFCGTELGNFHAPDLCPMNPDAPSTETDLGYDPNVGLDTGGEAINLVCPECGFDPCVCCEGCHSYPVCQCPDGDDSLPTEGQ